MKNILKSSILVLVLAVAGAASAQGMRGGFRMFGGMAQRDSFLLRREDVRRDLKLTTDQKAELDKLQQETMRFGRRDGGGNPPAGGGGFGSMTQEQMEQFRKDMEERIKVADEKVNTILDANQKTRLKQIGIQLAKYRAILREDVQKELGLSAETIEKAKALQAGAEKANGEVGRKMMEQEINREDGRAIIDKNGVALDEELGKLLDEAAKAKLKAMYGPEFKADEQPQGFRFGGG